MLIAVLAFSFAEAQSAFRQSATNPTGAITNTSTDTMSITLSKGYSSVSIQPVVTKATGTMAGTARLYYSVNGSNYTVIDSVSLTNVATQWTIWHVVNKPVRYFRVTVGGATTVTGAATAKIQTD